MSMYSLKQCWQTDGRVGLLALHSFHDAARAVACAHFVWHLRPSIQPLNAAVGSRLSVERQLHFYQLFWQHAHESLKGHRRITRSASRTLLYF